MYDGDELVLGIREDIREHIKKGLEDHQRSNIKKRYMGNKMQSEIYKGLEEPIHQW